MKKNYYLFNPGRISRKDNTLKFSPKDPKSPTKYLPVEGIDNLHVFGELDANSSMYNFLGKNQIAVHFYDYYENYTGTFQPKQKLLAGRLLVKQAYYAQNKSKRLKLAVDIIKGASNNMSRVLKYYANRDKDVQDSLERIENQLHNQIEVQKDIPSVMGIEGNIRDSYYQAFDGIINDFEFTGRSKRPPKCPVNALISFGNMLCYAECIRAIYQTQLNPTISFLHEPGERRFSLALDLAEIFKPILVDRMVFSVLNKKIVSKKDFDKKLNGIFLKEAGKKKFISQWEEKLASTIKHPKLNKKVSYKSIIKMECHKLVKHLMKIEDYEPFKAYW